jgi:predicted transcriptional regulator
VDGSDSLTSIMESMNNRKCGTVPVIQAGRIIGLLTLENISEMIMINSALERGDKESRGA